MAEQQQAEEKPEVQPAPLVRGRLQTREKAQNHWVATVEAGVTLKQVCDPRFWAFVATFLRPYDKIQVRTDDGTWYAELLVLWVDRTMARVRVLQDIRLTSAEVSETEIALTLTTVELRGPHKKWCVIDKARREILRQGIETRDDAIAEAVRVEQNIKAA